MQCQWSKSFVCTKRKLGWLILQFMALGRCKSIEDKNAGPTKEWEKTILGTQMKNELTGEDICAECTTPAFVMQIVTVPPTSMEAPTNHQRLGASSIQHLNCGSICKHKWSFVYVFWWKHGKCNEVKRSQVKYQICSMMCFSFLPSLPSHSLLSLYSNFI